MENITQKKGHKYFYTIVDENNTKFTGMVVCDPEDYDFESEKVGYEIASRRALIKILQHKKNYEIKPTLQSYRHLYNSMQQSKKFNPKSYEAKRIRNTIKDLEEDLNAYKEAIAQEQADLHTYILTKENTRNKLRAMKRAKVRNSIA